MTVANVYQPGVCNIGPAEIRRRRVSGYVSLAATVVLLVLAFALEWPAPWRLLAVIPATASAAGFLQGAFHFCARFGAIGLFNFGDLGSEEAVHEAEYRRKDQRKALLILALSIGIGVAVAVVAFLIPLR